MSLDLLATNLRTTQLFYHNCHNTVNGIAFASDHSFFGDAYAAVEGDYDSVVERLIGLEKEVNLSQINAKAATLLQHVPAQLEPSEMFKLALGFEHQLVQTCEKCDKDSSYTAGTRNLVGAIADAAEVRIYKIKQRIK